MEKWKNPNLIELMPVDGRKSFYGKAAVMVERDSNHRATRYSLYSYRTLVAWYDVQSGEFVRVWNGYSQTTMRHVNAFLRLLGYDCGGKAFWTAIPAGCSVKL